MIFFVYSLVSSAIHFARRQRLLAVLDAFFSSSQACTHVLVCRHLSKPKSSLEETPSSSVLSRYCSEPSLSSTGDSVLFRTETFEVVSTSLDSTASEWTGRCSRFLRTTFSSPRVDFIAVISREPLLQASSLDSLGEDGDKQMVEDPFYLCSSCERVATCPSRPWEQLFSSDVVSFCDAILAWSRDALFDVPGPKAALVSTIYTTCLPKADSLSARAVSTLSLCTQKARPLLEQLFLGDDLFSQPASSLCNRHASESALWETPLNLLSRAPAVIPYFRKARSRTLPRPSRRTPPIPEAALSKVEARVAESQVSAPFGASSSTVSETVTSFSPSITIDDFEEHSLAEIRSSCFPLPLAVAFFSRAQLRQLPCSSSRGASHFSLKERESRASGGPPQVDSGRRLSTAESGRVGEASASPRLSSHAEHASRNLADLSRGRLIPSRLTPLWLCRIEEELEESSSSSLSFIDRTPSEDGHLPRSSRKRAKKDASGLANGDMKKQEAKWNGNLEASSSGGASARGARCRGGESPMVEMFRRKMSATLDYDAIKVVDPKLQRLTAIELLQRRRHSSMAPVQRLQSLEAEEREARRESRRRSLSPVALQNTMIFGYTHTDLFSRGGSLFGSSDAFRSQSGTPTRRLHLSRDRKSSRKPMQKPPAVIVYTGGDSALFERIRESVHSVLPRDEYTVTELSPKALRTSPWNESSTACILLADTKTLDDASWARLHNYFSHSGKIMFLCQNNLLASLTNAESSKKQADLMKMAFGDRANSSLGKDFESFLKKALKSLSKSKEVNEVFHSKDLVGGFKYSVVITKKPDTPLLLYMENSAHQAAAVFSDATSEELLGPGSTLVRDSLARVGLRVLDAANGVPPLSQGFLVADHDDTIRNMVSIRYGEEIGLSPKLFLRRHERVADQPLPSPSSELLPVEVRKKEEGLPDFDERLYFKSLKAHRFGKVLLYVPVATTTMDICRSVSDAIPGYDGIVSVARQQTKGKGRGGNEFVSPIGAAMFTFNCLLPSSSQLAKSPCWIQHVFAVSAVDAIVTLASQGGVDDFPLRIKWPNDFYWNRQFKLGGLLATARVRDDCMEVILGAGVNVRNSKPTVCLNDMLPENTDYEFTVEEVIASTMSKFEQYLQLYERKGRDEFLKKYYEYWLHSREEVLLEEEGERVLIRGLDQNGYLEVRSRKNPNKIFSLMDDGNTFDMMKGLIRPKFK